MEENANPEAAGSENPSPINIEAAFDDYLQRQASPAGDEGGEKQPATEAGDGQSEGEAKPESSESTEAEEQRVKVKINGEERDVPLSELVKGYQLESDYRIKTSQAAEQSRAAQAQMQQAQQLQAQYAQQLQAYAQQLQTTQPQPPDPSLIESDPVGFMRQQQAYQNWQNQMQQVQVEQHQLAMRHQQQMNEAMAQQHARESELLLAALPEWKDAEKAKTGKAEISSYLRKQGYAQEEIAQAVDHRAIVLANKAMLYDQMMAKQAATSSKVANLPPKAPQRPGSGNTSALDGRTRAMQSLKKSGSIDDAANAFAAMLSR